MTKTVRNTGAASEESFHEHYAAIWGEERWKNSLYPALAEPTRYVALANQYVPPANYQQALASGDQGTNGETELLTFPDLHPDQPGVNLVCYIRPLPTMEGDDTSTAKAGLDAFPPPQQAKSSPLPLLTHWNLDGASALVAHLIDAREGDKVLDSCAAPGGKSVAIAQKLWPTLRADASYQSAPLQSRLVSNEADSRRQKRLQENLQAYLPPRIFKQKLVTCTKVDASQPGPGLIGLLALGPYDRVLVDAPCSSERHIVHAHIKAKSSSSTASEMAQWRPGSSKRLAKTQVDILMTALKACKVGGLVMYATCSIEPVENDGVIEKMLALVEKEWKKGGKWTVKLGFGEGEEGARMNAELEKWAEKTKYGWIVLPDHAGGGRWGPLFFARIAKTAP